MSEPGHRPAPARGFPDSEYERRLQRVQRSMHEAQMDAILLTTEADVRYFSGFLTQFWQSPTRPWYLVVPVSGKPIAVIPVIGAECMGRTWVEDIRTWSSPHPEDDGISLLSGCLREVAPEVGRIGLPMDRQTHARMPVADLDELRRCSGARQWVDAGPLLREVRMVKSELEVEKIRHVCQLACDAFDTAPAIFTTGSSEREIFRQFKLRCLSLGVDDVSYLVGSAGAGGYRDIISPPSERELRPGDVLILDTGCQFDGYFCDFDRNFAFGFADDDVRRAYDTVYQATEAGLAMLRPGVRCKELFHAMQGVLEAGGALGNDVGRMGHGLGIELTEPPSHAAFDETVLEVGMVITLEPGMSFAAGKLMVHEENVVLREHGPELLTRRAAPQLPVL